jgi:MFS family permease
MTPGALVFTAAGLVARLPTAMVSIALLVLVEHSTGSYAIAGAVAGTAGVFAALGGPVLARLVDRRGQRPVLLFSAAVQTVGLVALVWLAQRSGSVPALYAAAVVAGVGTVSVGSLTRARWSYLLRGSTLLGTAYAFESILDEVVFIVGPVLVTALATGVDESAGVLLSAALLLVGAVWLGAQRRTEPPAARRAGATPVAGALSSRALVLVCLVLFLAAGVFGSVEVFAIAYAEDQGAPGAAGPLLAAFAAGSLLAGLGYGAVSWRSSLRRRFPVTVGGLAAGVALLPLAGRLSWLAALLALAGAAIAPMLITAFTLVEGIVPAHRLTEGLTWATLSVNLSYAGSTAVAGAVIASAGPHAGAVVPIVCSLTALLVAVTGARALP